MRHRPSLPPSSFTAYGVLFYESLRPTKALLKLLPIDISFEKVGDNWEIEDNKDANGNWMPGKGKRMFVDAKTPQESTLRDKVYVKLKSLPQGGKVRLAAFDVDDPTTDEADPEHVIDSNDTASIKRGNDNRLPVYFAPSGGTVDCTVDAQGVAKLANGELPKLQMSAHAGDNVRVAVTFLKADGSPMDNLDVLQVSDSTQSRYVPGDSEKLANDFSGGLSPMLTVWRKLNVEVDSMQAVATSGSEKNFQQGVVQRVDSGPLSGQTTVTVDITLNGTEDAYENGYLTVGGVSYKISSNTEWSPLTNSDQAVVKGIVPSSSANQSFTIVDDDDHFLSQLGLGSPLPRHDTHASMIAGIRASFVPAYIQLEDANQLGLNPRQTIPFKLNSVGASIFGSVFSNAKDLADSEKFWAITLVFGYQPEAFEDYDPSTEDFTKGVSPKTYGVAVVYIEVIRDATLTLFEASSISLNDPSFVAERVAQFYNILYGTAAHEIGHNPGGQTPQQDHDELGLMQKNGTGINVPFSPSTIRRFRNAKQWVR